MEFTKKDLKDGMIVQYRSGEYRAVIGINLCLISDDNAAVFNNLNAYLENLISPATEANDIIIVFTFDNAGNKHILFDRNELIEEMTMDQVCKALNKKIKIIS